jgi:hypothetical protein
MFENVYVMFENVYIGNLCVELRFSRVTYKIKICGIAA